MKLQSTICFVALIIFSNYAFVQPSHSADFETWADITTIYSISDRWRYDGTQGIRGLLSGDDFTQLFFRPSVRYQAKPWITVHGGIRFFWTGNDLKEDAFEIGPYQGIRFLWPNIGSYTISHYLRREQRMIWVTEGARDFDFSLRGRYQLGAQSPVYDILFKNGLFLKGSIEAFADIESPVFVDRLRYDLGAGTKVSEAWRVELHYFLQQERDSSGSSFSASEHVVRLRLYYSFN